MKKNNYKESDLFYSRLMDLYSQCDRYHEQVNTQFFNEEELAKAVKFLGKKYLYKIDGGYPNARRSRIAFLYDEDEYMSDIVCLVSKVNQKFVKITHSDVLGALMSLEIDRNHFGDLFVLNEQIVVYVTKMMAEYVKSGCTQIHHNKVRFEISSDHLYAEQEYSVQSINIASFRLDNVVSALVPCSRKDAVQIIKLKQVSINHEVIEDCSKLCHNGTVISISRCGRFEIIDEGKTSRKDRHIVKVKKFL